MSDLLAIASKAISRTLAFCNYRNAFVPSIKKQLRSPGSLPGPNIHLQKLKKTNPQPCSAAIASSPKSVVRLDKLTIAALSSIFALRAAVIATRASP